MDNRLDNNVFRLDPRIGREGNYYYSARYFPKACEIIKEHKYDSTCVLQVFQKENDVIIVGTDFYIELIKQFAECSLDEIKVYTVKDGYKAKSLEPIMQIEAPYWGIGFLESVALGHMKRASGVATNAYKCAKSANGKPILFMADRNDSHLVQSIDGYSCYKSGINAFATDAMCAYWDGSGTGTIPHSLIAHFNGDIVKTCNAYLDVYPNDRLISLVDFNNDVINDSVNLIKDIGSKVYGVRIDTSQGIIDKWVFEKFYQKDIMALGKFDPRGVCKPLVCELRKQLDMLGEVGKNVKIVVSGGFDEKKIKNFEDENVPVDIYGVGTSLLSISGYDFTQDVVKVDGENCAKVGRGFINNPNLELYKW